MLRVFLVILVSAAALTSCASAPLEDYGRFQANEDAAAQGQNDTAHSTAPSLSGSSFMPLRVGVEYLPPPQASGIDSRSLLEATPLTERGRRFRAQRGAAPRGNDRPLDEVVVTPLYAPRSKQAAIDAARGEPDREGRSSRSVWHLTSEELDQIEDPSERLTLRFVNDIVGEDRRRMRRELGTPILMTRRRSTIDDGLHVPFDDLVREDEETFINDVGPRLLRRPLRNLLKKATFLNDVELALNKFKADHVPLSGAYHERSNQRRRQWGRVSMRLRLSDGSDPLELTYYNWGWRMSSSKERGRLLYRFRVADRLDGNIRYRFNYITHDTGIRGDLRYEFDPDTHVYMLFGDRLDFLAGPTAYSLLNSPLDGTPGVLFYVEHLF